MEAGLKSMRRFSEETEERIVMIGFSVVVGSLAGLAGFGVVTCIVSLLTGWVP